MEQPGDEKHRASEIDGFATASVIIGSISLFYGDRFLYPNPDNYFLLSLLLPAAGLCTGYIAQHRVRQQTTTRGSELATAGLLLSGISVLLLAVTQFGVN